MILTTTLLAAIIAVILAYKIAGKIWVVRHSMHFTLGDTKRRCCGAIGEVIIILFAATLVFLMDEAAATTSISSIISKHPIISIISLIGVTAIVYTHGIITALSAPKTQKRRLLYTYLVYGIYSTIIFTGGAILVTLLIVEIFSDLGSFGTKAAMIIDAFSNAETLSIDFRKNLEFLYLDGETLLATVEDSMAPVFLFAAGIFAINLSIRLTPLRTLFVNNAMLLTHISTIIGLLSVLIIGGWVYVGHYTNFIETMLAALQQARPYLSDASPDTLQRYTELILQITEQKTVVGFITKMSNEWGGVAAILGIAQWIAEQFNKKESKASSANAGK